MRVIMPGLGEVALTKRHFVARGAEGAVYAREGLAYKIYHQRDQVLPAGKLRELAGLTHPSVIHPEQLVTDLQGRAVGFAMRHLPDTWPLCRLFTRAFRDRHGIDGAVTMALVSSMADTLRAIHTAGVCVVDMNELNLLVGPGFDTVYFIDVDSWQTPRYPATAIADSIRDPQVVDDVFDTRSDWFAFAVVSFQLLMGIHPFKGKHPTVTGLAQRMAAGISVFDPEVQLPGTCAALESLPMAWRDWYMATFEQGARTPPPASGGPGPVLVPARLASGRSDALQVSELAAFDAPILRVHTHRSDRYVVTRGGVFRGAHRIAPAPAGPFALGFSNKEGRPVMATVAGDTLRLMGLDPQGQIDFDMRVAEFVGVDGRIVARVGEQLVEIVLRDLGDGIVATPKPIANVLRHATRLFDGVAIQDLMGEAWAVLLNEIGASQVVALPELDGVQVIDARLDRRVLMVTGQVDGDAHRWVFRFDPDLSYDVRRVAESGASSPSFVTLDNGVCVCRTEEDTITVFHARSGASGMKTIAASAIAGDVWLVAAEGQVLVASGDRLLRVSLEGQRAA